MATILFNDFNFTLLDEIQQQYPELVDLVLRSESIDNAQKQDWFDILPSMTNEQIDRLFNIFMTERISLQKLDLQFQENVKALHEKHLITWQSLQSQKTKEKIAEAEKNDSSKQDAENALDALNMF